MMNQSKFEWPCETHEYAGLDIKTNKIGQGAFSNVYKCICRKNQTEVAIKIMDLENITTTFDDILSEVQTMRLCDHNNILRCFCSFVSKDKLWLVLEYMDKGSCLRIMNIASKIGIGLGMNEDWLAYILKETLKGLSYLHNSGHIHRDIKPGNILINSIGEVKLADFGVAGWILSRGQRHENVRTFVGTIAYMALVFLYFTSELNRCISASIFTYRPEVMEQSQGYDQKADIYSLGIMLLTISNGFHNCSFMLRCF